MFVDVVTFGSDDSAPQRPAVGTGLRELNDSLHVIDGQVFYLIFDGCSTGGPLLGTNYCIGTARDP